MAVTDDDFRRSYTINTGPGNGSPQPSPSDSYGGFSSHTPYYGGTLHDLFGATPNPLTNGYTDYRCVFAYNASIADTMYAVRTFISAQPDNGTLQVGVDPIGVRPLSSSTAQATRPASATTAPVGVVFSSAAEYATGVLLGDLAPGAGCGIWIKRTPLSSQTTQVQGTMEIRGSTVPVT